MRSEIKWMGAGGCLTLVGLGAALGTLGGLLTVMSRADRAYPASVSLSQEKDEAAMDRPMEEAMAEVAAAMPAAPPPSVSKSLMASAPARGDARGGGFAGEDKKADDAENGLEGKRDADSDGEAQAPRSWFPETFLFEPAVVTDGEGRAQVSFVAPDRLTGWRILGLAHDRSGHQAGALTRFQTALDVYVDLVVPRFLTVGDEVELPVLVVNTSDQSRSAAWTLEASGAGWRSVQGDVAVAGGGSTIKNVPLQMERAGTLTVRSAFGDLDTVERTIEVRPEGIPAFVERTGSLGAPKKLVLEGGADLDPRTADVRLVVYGGLQSVIEEELRTAGSRADDVAQTGYVLELAHIAPDLLQKVGAEADADTLRALVLLGAQRAIRWSRSPDALTMGLLADPTIDHQDNVVLARLGQRLVAQLAQSQHPDGTFGGDEGGWPLQRVLVATGELAVAAASGESEADRRLGSLVTLRAQGAVERYLGRIEDPYTAAVLAASGVASRESAIDLQRRVREAVVEEEGLRHLPVPKGVVRPDGTVPSEVEATAWALRALHGAAESPWTPDLAAYLLASYRPGRGWGDGRTNLVVLRALASITPKPLEGPISLSLVRDGTTIGHGTLDLAQGETVVVLDAREPEPHRTHTYEIVADPPAPGLSFTLTLRAWRPISAATSVAGLEVVTTVPSRPVVGKVAGLAIEAAAPSGLALELVVPLPAGVDPLGSTLDQLVASGRITSWQNDEGSVTLQLPALPAGGRFAATLDVVPTLAGELHAGATTLAPVGRPGDVSFAVPSVWRVGRR